MIHELKELPFYFDAVRNGDKTFELRKADREFHIGDHIALNEWTEKGGYTGRAMLVRITDILYIDQIIGHNCGFAILAIKLVRVERPGGLAYKGATIELDNPRSEVPANG